MEDEDATAFDAAGAQPGAGDMVQVEHEGEVYEVPAALQNAFLAQTDYAQKMQALSGHARELDTRHHALGRAAELAEQALADRAQLHVLDLHLATYQGVDWNGLAAEDPQRAELLWRQFQETQAVRAEFAQVVAHSHDRRRLDAEREKAQQFASAGQVLAREIEGWSPDVANKLVEYAAAFGVTLDELREVADPRLWRILHRAQQGDEAAQRQATADSTAQIQAVRPAVTVTGAAAGSGGVRDELGAAEWMRRRNAQVTRG
ncbi:hypothetical protein [Phenylobacterium sp.]|jgi:hypothetical protein|uniref:hypothetical protein n=1 Tax=Phenylobacterium sp. TaxID=1871053 RepID=UPI002F40A6B9